MTNGNRHISVIEPVNLALGRVREILFRPFNFLKWLAIGFCAWLANLGGGGSPNFNYGKRDYKQNLSQFGSEIRDFVNEYWPVVIVLAAIVLIVVIIVSVVFLWLRSRGQFMFLHCIVKNEAKISEPWNRYGKEGNKLFVFNLVAAVISSVVFAILVAMIILCALLIAEGGPTIAVGVIGLVPAAILSICAVIMIMLVRKFTVDFVVPIMYLRRCGPVEGWRIFLRLLSSNIGYFFLYVLFRIVIGIVIFVIAFVLPCCLCCCGCCVILLLSLPYIWAVVMLPVLMFTRLYSLHYLRQFGPEWDVFAPKTVVPLTMV